MTLEQLRIFVAVAEREHVTRAAHDLNLTQSATSAAVAALESRYATKLFDRVGRRIVLTDAGRLFLGEAKAVLARAATAELVLADLAGLKVGSLALAASQTVGNYWLPKFMQHFRADHPGIDLSLSIGNTETVSALIRDGEANLGFVEGEVDEPNLLVSSIAEDEMVLVAAPNHPWADLPRIDRPELMSARWVLREVGSGTRATVAGLVKDAGASMDDLDVTLVLPTNETVRSAVEAGAGVTVMSRIAAESALESGRLIVVPYQLQQRRFFMLRHRDHHSTAAETAFVRSIGTL
jgi:DNA-binding transcriptional LysR family regulator